MREDLLTWLVYFDIRLSNENLTLVEGVLVEPIYLIEDIAAGLEVRNVPMLEHFFVLEDDSDLGVTQSLSVAIVFGLDRKGVLERVKDVSLCLSTDQAAFIFLNRLDKDFDVPFVGAVLPDHQ